ncbi:MAG: hypothetical protein IID45_04205, partial [Planctomycetes bacterium]|nr:hypothetical protein [Planctomycetota bacterium]
TFVGVILLAACGVGLYYGLCLWDARSGEDPQITISKETTYITEPLDADGYPDYAAAINRRFGKGVTAENNAAVLLLRAYGPKEIPKKWRAELFKKLGMEPLPEKGDYFIDLYDFEEGLRKRGVRFPELQSFDSNKAPWRRTEFPRVADWLSQNQVPIALSVEAGKKTRWFIPMANDDGMPTSLAEMSLLFAIREAGENLSAKAMFSIGENKNDAAIEDALSCHRLVRLFVRPAGILGYLIAVAIDAGAFNIDRALIETGRLSTVQIMALSTSLRKLGPFPGFADKYDFQERCSSLSSIIAWSRREKVGNLRALDSDASEELKKAWSKNYNKIRLRLVDWNVVLKYNNRLIDRGVKIARMDQRGKRIEALESLTAEVKTLREQTGSLLQYIEGFSFIKSNRVGATNWFKHAFGNQIVKHFQNGLIVQDMARTRYDITLIGLGLAAYQAERGSYPQTLARLTPKYAAAVPADLFSGKPLKYKRTENGFLLYSVGRNGKDEGGTQPASGRDSGFDDIAIQVPAPDRR